MARTTQNSWNTHETLDPVIQEESPFAWKNNEHPSSSWDRGVDQMQASLYGFASAIGGVTGIDVLQEWGEEGVQRNLEELKRNPPEVHSWDDVDSLADFGTYVVESLGEQAPQLLADVAVGIGATLAFAPSGGASAGALGTYAAARTAATQAAKGFTKKQLAQLGKKIKRMPKMQEAFTQFERVKGKVPAAALDVARTANGKLGQAGKRLLETPAGVVAVGLNNVAQNAGETQMTFLQEGIDAPGTALLAGTFKGALDTLTPARLLGISKKLNVPAADLPQVFARAAREMGATAVQEGATEAAQTVVDHVAQRIHDSDFEMFSDEAWNEIWTAATKGAIVGGTLGGATSAVREGAAFRRSKDELINGAEDELDAAVQAAMDPNNEDTDTVIHMAEDTQPPMEPESQETIDAQARTIDDPTSTKDTMEVTDGSPMPTERPAGAIEVPTKNGVALTTNPDKADLIASTGGDEAAMGEVLFNAPGGKQKANGEVVVAKDARGNPIFERATNPDDRKADLAEAQRQAPEGGSVSVDSAENVVAARMANSGDKVTLYGDTAPVIPLEQQPTAERGSDAANRVANERLNESALRAALNEVFRGDEQKAAFGLSVMTGERQIDERVATRLAEMVAPVYQRLLKEDSAYVDERQAREELVAPELTSDGEVDYNEPVDAVEQTGERDEFDSTLVEGEAVAPIIRATNNGVKELGTFRARDLAENRAESLRQENPGVEYQVTKKGGSKYAVNEVTGFADRTKAEQQLESMRVIEQDPETGENRIRYNDEMVGDAGIVERNGRFYIEEQLKPDQVTPSPVIRRNDEITPYGPGGNTTMGQYVLDFMNDTTARSQQRRRLQAQQKDEKTTKLIEDTIVTFEDADGLEHEVLAPDILTLGQELLKADGVKSNLDGDSWYEAAWTRGVAELRAQGWTANGKNKDPLLRAPNFKTGKGKQTRLSQIVKQDRKNRGKGQDSPISPMTDDQGRTIDPVGDEVSKRATIRRLGAVQRKLEAARGALAAWERRVAQSSGEEYQRNYQEADRLKREIRDLERVEENLKKTQANFAATEDADSTDVEIAGQDGVENMNDLDSGFYQQSDETLQADGTTSIESARLSTPTDAPRNRPEPIFADGETITEADIEENITLEEAKSMHDFAAYTSWLAARAAEEARLAGDNALARNIEKHAEELRKQAQASLARAKAAEDAALKQRLASDPEFAAQNKKEADAFKAEAGGKVTRAAKLRVEVQKLKKAEQTENVDHTNEIADLERRATQLEKEAQALRNEAKRLVPPRTDRDIDQSKRGKTRGFGKISKDAVNFVEGILRSVGMSNVHISMVDFGSIQQLVDAGLISKTELKRINEKMADPQRMALFIPRGESGIVIVKPIADRGMYFSTLGHEIGHGIYNAIEGVIRNPKNAREKALQKRLFAAYQADKNSDASYVADGGFKEWFADKIAASARGMTQKKDKGIVERFFASSAERLRKVFNTTKGNTHPRFHRNLKFENVIKAYREDGVFQRMQNMGYGEMESLVIDVDTVRNTVGVRKLRQGVDMLKAFGTRAWNKSKDSPLRTVFDVDSRLRMLGSEIAEIADMIYKQTSSRGGNNAYWTRVQNARTEYEGRINQAISRMTQQHREMVFWELAQELPNDQISDKAKEIRAIIKDFHQYLLDSGLPMGEVENYFPRSYNSDKILANADKFLQVLRDNGYDQASAIEVFEALTAPPNYRSMEGFAPKRLPVMFERMINVDTARALMAEGFLNADPQHALLSYVRKYTREAEHRATFGGWHYLDGYTTAPTLGRMDDLERRRAEQRNQQILEGYLERYGFLEPLNNTQRSPDDLQADFQRGMEEAIRRGFAQPDGQGTIMWIHPDARLDSTIRRAVEAKAANENLTLGEKDALYDEVRMLVDHALDRADPKDPNSVTYNLIGEVRAFESLRTLAFSGIASIPEAAAAFARAKNEMGIREFGRAIFDQAKSGEEMTELARLIGAISDDMGASMGTEMWSPYDGHGNFRFFRNALPWMFKINMNDKVVNYSRALALRTGIQFLTMSAEKAIAGSARHARYLEELGIDAMTVMQWKQATENTNLKRATTARGTSAEAQVARKVRNALNRFIDESVLRPTAPERPTWAAHPIGTFVFHLKTFAYSFTKNIAGGLAREFATRAGEAQGTNWQRAAELTMMLAPMMFVFMAMGAVSDEFRERIKSFGAKGTFTDRSLLDSMWTWFDRTGLVTSAPFVEPLIRMSFGGDIAYNATFAAGPTASHLYDLMGDDNGLTQNEVVRSIPIVSQMPFLRNALYKDFG